MPEYTLLTVEELVKNMQTPFGSFILLRWLSFPNDRTSQKLIWVHWDYLDNDLKELARQKFFECYH